MCRRRSHGVAQVVILSMWGYHLPRHLRQHLLCGRRAVLRIISTKLSNLCGQVRTRLFLVTLALTRSRCRLTRTGHTLPRHRTRHLHLLLQLSHMCHLRLHLRCHLAASARIGKLRRHPYSRRRRRRARLVRAGLKTHLTHGQHLRLRKVPLLRDEREVGRAEERGGRWTGGWGWWLLLLLLLHRVGVVSGVRARVGMGRGVARDVVLRRVLVGVEWTWVHLGLLWLCLCSGCFGCVAAIKEATRGQRDHLGSSRRETHRRGCSPHFRPCVGAPLNRHPRRPDVFPSPICTRDYLS